MAICWLFGRAAAIIVTLIAVSSTTGIVRPGAAFEGGSGVTGATIQAGRNVIVIFTKCRRTIVTGRTVINNAGMIESSADEASGCMTDAAVLVSCYMAACFTYGVLAIMTGATVVHDANMIKGPGYKSRGLVAVTAITGGRHMVRWRCFSSGSCTIVA